jgi:hypothetical protein
MGFGYDPVFVPLGAAIRPSPNSTRRKSTRISHRADAFAKLVADALPQVFAMAQHPQIGIVAEIAATGEGFGPLRSRPAQIMIPAQRAQAHIGAGGIVFGKPFLLRRKQRALVFPLGLRQGGRGCHKQHKAGKAGKQGHVRGTPHGIELSPND